MKYLDLTKLSDSQLKRYTGLSRSQFSPMVEQIQMQFLSDIDLEKEKVTLFDKGVES